MKGHAAGFVRRLDGPEAAFRAPLVWWKRMETAAQEGLSPHDAQRRWKGAPEDPEGGRTADDAEEREAESLDALEERAAPGWVDPYEELLERTRVEHLPDGTPVDRSRGDWGPLSPMVLPDTDYPALTEAAVRYLAVTRSGVVLGYLWASVTDDAAYYVPRADAGDDGVNAGLPWVLRLREAAEEGLPRWRHCASGRAHRRSRAAGRSRRTRGNSRRPAWTR